MAPPTKFARLNQINPDQLGRDVADGVRAHVQRLAFDLGIATHDTGPCNLAISVADLARYAQVGAGLDAPVQEYLTSICPPVWTRAADAGTYDTRELDAADPDTLMPDRWLDQLVLVIRAALARESLAAEEPIGPAGLAVLSSMAAGAIRLACQDGKIPAERDASGWRILPDDARRWLADVARRREAP